MNVVILNDYAHVNGGAARVAVLSAIGLAKAGYKVTFIASVGPVSADLQKTKGLSITCLQRPPYNASPFRRSAMAGLWDLAAARSIGRILDALKPRDTVLHVHSNRDALSSSVLWEAIRRDIPLVYTCHEYGLACPYASFFDHKEDAICQRRPLSVSCLVAHCNRKGYDKKVWSFTRQWIQNGLLGLPRKLGDVIFVSDFSRRILEPFVGTQARLHTLRNPVDAERGIKRRLAPDSSFVFVGLLTPGKDPVLAAKAAAEIGAPIRFVGDGELHKDVMEANPHAQITGWLDPADVKSELKRARAIVLPARWYETQGLVVQEAAALGVPAIVSSTSAASEEVHDGESGLIIPAGDGDALTRAMQRLLNDQTAREMGEAASERFWSNPPTWPAHLKGLAGIYEGALSHG